jgi:hypothetical protein
MQHSKVNDAASTGTFLLFAKDKESLTGRNMIGILPEILETKEFCLKAQNMV